MGILPWYPKLYNQKLPNFIFITMQRLVVGYGGQNDNANDIHATTGVAAYIINQTQFKTGLNGSVGTEKMYWLAAGW